MRTVVVNRGVITKGLLRASTASLALVLFLAPAEAQLANGQLTNPPPPPPAGTAAAPAAPAAPQRTIQHIVVSGTQRVEETTVLTYITLREGDPYNHSLIERAERRTGNER